MLFSSFVPYQIAVGKLPDSPEEIAEALEGHAFTPLLDLDVERVGFTAPVEKSDSIAFDLGDGTTILALRTDKKSIPASAVKRLVAERAEQIEATQGYPVGRKQRKELTEDIVTELLPKALATSKTDYLIIRNNYLYIGVGSQKSADTAVSHVLRALEGIGFEFPFHSGMINNMTTWLLEDAVEGDELTVGDIAVLESGDSSVQWKNHTAEEDDLQRHIVRDGKRVTKLRLNYAPQHSELDAVGFTLSDKGIVGQVKAHAAERATDGDDANDAQSRWMANAALTAFVCEAVTQAVVDALGKRDM